MIPAAAPEVTDAVRRNMALLIQLRWLAVGGQLFTILFVDGPMGIALPMAPLLAAILLLVLINLGTLYMLRSHDAGLEYALFAALMFDIAALTWQLHFTGGLANPFAALFLLQVVIGAMLLRPAASWTMVAATLCALAILAADSVPLALPADLQDDEFSLYLQGSFVCFGLIAVLLVAFVTRIARNLRERDAALAAIRQRAAEEDHIVRMGLLASGAAHELGTPLATLSVLVNDFRAMPELAASRDLAADLADMEIAVRRCKTIVSGILMSAGEARGEAPER
ncbi:MAG: sensor histidine kinase, partial [Blastomonas sp.]|nr:sensor histidine kinase [Blastomonas sp.]